MDSSVRTVVRNLSDSTRVFYHYGNRVELKVGESIELVGGVSAEVSGNVAFGIGLAFEDKKPKKKKV